MEAKTMNAKQIGLTVVLLDFLALTAYAVVQHGYLGFFEIMLGNAATTTALVDLLIALSLIAVWMARDAREHGISPLPYLVATLVLGSAGPLLYLIRRLALDTAKPARLATRAA
jgi:hypothetical protein